jgi:hypothetical protein
MIQLSAARTELLNRKKDLSDVSSQVFISWCNQIQRFVYRELIKTDPERFITTDTIAVIAGTQSYALPSDFKSIAPAGCGVFDPADNGDDRDNRLTLTGYGSTKVGYYLNGANIILTPKPVRNDSYTLRYIPTITTFTALTDYFTTDATITGQPTISDEYLDYVLEALDVRYTIWDEDPSSEGLSDVRFTRALNELLGDVRRIPDAYDLPDYTSIY